MNEGEDEDIEEFISSSPGKVGSPSKGTVEKEIHFDE